MYYSVDEIWPLQVVCGDALKFRIEEASLGIEIPYITNHPPTCSILIMHILKMYSPVLSILLSLFITVLNLYKIYLCFEFMILDHFEIFHFFNMHDRTLHKNMGLFLTKKKGFLSLVNTFFQFRLKSKLYWFYPL